MRTIGAILALALLAGATAASRADNVSARPTATPRADDRSTASTSESRANGRPEQCPAQDWCGCWLATYLGIKDQRQWRELWVARNWAAYGRPADGPAPGVIAVYARGDGGHVGIVTAVRRTGFVVLKSGNDGGTVRERERSTAGVIAWRLPGDSGKVLGAP